jgi:hypothetical protein
MKNSLSRTPDSEWRQLRQEASRLDNVVRALREGGAPAAFTAIDAPEPKVPLQRRRAATAAAARCVVR